MWQAASFVVLSAGLIYLSRRSLARARSHGFYRFFAWEFILALLLLNVARWFHEWQAWHQLISWVLLIVCIVPLVYGVQALRKRGTPNAAQRSEPELLAFERTTRLVTDGIYRYIRHPLYSSLLFLAWGIFFKDMTSWAGVGLALAATLFLTLTARAEEGEDIRFFGTAYQDYMRRTKMFVPFLF